MVLGAICIHQENSIIFMDFHVFNCSLACFAIQILYYEPQAIAVPFICWCFNFQPIRPYIIVEFYDWC